MTLTVTIAASAVRKIPGPVAPPSRPRSRPVPVSAGRVALLARCREAVAALEAVADLHHGCACPVCVEAAGTLFHCDLYHSMLFCSALPNELRAATRRAARLADDAHADPLRRVLLAFRSFEAVARRVDALHRRCPGCGTCRWAAGIAYQLDVYALMWESVIPGRI